jgi:FkbM family methyltransferase
VSDFFLRAGTQDEEAYEEVVRQNQYRLPERFAPGSVVLDVGAQIGCFARACFDRGAARVYCFEPERSNFDLLARNLSGKNAVLVNRPVWRSDRKEKVSLVHAGPRTALHFVRAGGEHEAEMLDDWLRHAGEVRLLKLDCEGAEYPALWTSRELGRCRQIACELHPVHAPLHGKEFDCSAAGVRGLLRGQGFAVDLEPVQGHLHQNQLLFARRDSP